LETLGRTLGFGLAFSKVKTLASQKNIQARAEKRKATDSGITRNAVAKLA